jgi:hypothetical protein
MTTFSTNTELVTRISGGTATLESLTDATPYDAAKVDAARQKAYGMIVGWIAARGTIPADTSAYPGLTALLREFELDLVEFELWGGVREDIPARVKERRKQTWDFLVAVSKGDAQLAGLGDLPAPEMGGTQGQVVGPERVMTRESLGGVF